MENSDSDDRKSYEINQQDFEFGAQYIFNTNVCLNSSINHNCVCECINNLNDVATLGWTKNIRPVGEISLMKLVYFHEK